MISKKIHFLPVVEYKEKKWFNYYLNTIGFSFNEIETGIEDYIFSLKNNAPAHIIGFYLGNNEKHTVVYEGIENNLYKYLNNQQPRRRASGYVVLIRWLQSALIPFVTTQSVAEKRQVLNPPHE